jgi:hypothetical protein
VEAFMKKSTLFLTGMAALLLSFGLILAACSSDDDGGGGSSFDGSTLAGTTWVAEEKDAPFDASMLGGPSGLTMDLKGTLAFTSDAGGTFTYEVTKWKGNWTTELKTKIGGFITSMSGPVTYTYDAAAKTGTYTRTEKDPSEDEPEKIVSTFTVDVGKKTLTSVDLDKDGNPELDDDGNEDITVANLQ